MINEESSGVLSEYYEGALKFKYMSAGEADKGVRTMIDLVHDTIDSPFDSLIADYVCKQMRDTPLWYLVAESASEFNNNFNSQYNAYKEAWQTVLSGTVLPRFRNMK